MFKFSRIFAILGIFSIFTTFTIQNSISLPSLVTSGLVFNVDPSNLASYSGSGTSVNDVSGFSGGALSGTLSGAGFDSVNKTFTFDSQTAKYINFGSGVYSGRIPSTPVDISVELWIKPTSWNTDWNIFLTKWFSDLAGAAANDFHFAIRKSNYCVGKLDLYIVNAVSDFCSNASIPLNIWSHIGFTYATDKTTKLFIDGKVDTTTTGTNARVTNTSALLIIGDARSTPSAPTTFNGSIARVRIWNKALSDAEIRQNYESEAVGFGRLQIPSLTFNASNPKKNIRTNLTLTSNSSGSANFKVNGRAIPKCSNVNTVSYVATCQWLPLTLGQVSVTADFTSTQTDTYTTNTSSSTYLVTLNKRTISR